MKVCEVMNAKVITCKPNDKICDVVRRLKDLHITGMPVVEENKLVGVVAESDILRAVPFSYHILEGGPEGFAKLREIGKKPVSEIMTREAVTVSPIDGIEAAAQLMVKHRINRVPVVDRGKLVGIVTRGDIIRVLGEAK